MRCSRNLTQALVYFFLRFSSKANAMVRRHSPFRFHSANRPPPKKNHRRTPEAQPPTTPAKFRLCFLFEQFPLRPAAMFHRTPVARPPLPPRESGGRLGEYGPPSGSREPDPPYQPLIAAARIMSPSRRQAFTIPVSLQDTDLSSFQPLGRHASCDASVQLSND